MDNDNLQDQIKGFFNSTAFAVVGASKNREKYGNKVVRCYLQHNKVVYPVHPLEKHIENLPCINNISDLPEQVKSISIITPPQTTEKIIAQIINKGQIKNIWMQPGSESQKAIMNCKKNNINVIAGGPCVLVFLGFKE